MLDEWMLSKKSVSFKSRLLVTKEKLTAAKPIKFVSTLLVLSIIALTIFVLVAPHFGFVFLTVMGGSMEPALPVGSIAIVQRIAPAQIDVGDIIAYRAQGDQGPVVTHRVTEVLSRDGAVSFQTRGDGNKVPDIYPVPSSGVVGKVQVHIPLVGFILSFVRQPMGYGLLIGLPALVIIVIMTRRVSRQIASLKGRKRVMSQRKWLS